MRGRFHVVEAECHFCALSDAWVLIENTCVVEFHRASKFDGIATRLGIVWEHVAATAAWHLELFIVAERGANALLFPHLVY